MVSPLAALIFSRYIAAKFANTIFPFGDPDRAVICLIAFADSKLEVREIGKCWSLI
jgi:hypothetical protein